MPRLTSLACGVSLLWLAACTSEEPPPVVDPPPGELIAGTAAFDGSGFVETTSGQDAELVPGAQGGFHVWINFRVTKTEGALYVERQARRVDNDALILRGQRVRVDVPANAMTDWWQPDFAAPAFMCPSPLGLQVFDTEVSFQVVLSDDEGEIVAEDEIILTPRCPSGDQHDFCVEICSG